MLKGKFWRRILLLIGVVLVLLLIAGLAISLYQYLKFTEIATSRHLSYIGKEMTVKGGPYPAFVQVLRGDSRANVGNLRIILPKGSSNVYIVRESLNTKNLRNETSCYFQVSYFNGKRTETLTWAECTQIDEYTPVWVQEIFVEVAE